MTLSDEPGYQFKMATKTMSGTSMQHLWKYDSRQFIPYCHYYLTGPVGLLYCRITSPCIATTICPRFPGGRCLRLPRSRFLAVSFRQKKPDSYMKNGDGELSNLNKIKSTITVWSVCWLISCVILWKPSVWVTVSWTVLPCSKHDKMRFLKPRVLMVFKLSGAAIMVGLQLCFTVVQIIRICH